MTFRIVDDGRFLWLTSEHGPQFYLCSLDSLDPLKDLLLAVQQALNQRGVFDAALDAARLVETPVENQSDKPRMEYEAPTGMDWNEVQRLSAELKDTLGRMAALRAESQFKSLQADALKTRLDDATAEIDRLRALLGK